MAKPKGIICPSCKVRINKDKDCIDSTTCCPICSALLMPEKPKPQYGSGIRKQSAAGGIPQNHSVNNQDDDDDDVDQGWMDLFNNFPYV